MRRGLGYAFGDLLGDIGKWLLLGILIAGLLSALIPEEMFQRFFGNELLSLLLMLGVGIPLYICASASTPIAAALVLKGLSPGAALVFLLAGPATNAATLSVIGSQLGRAATLRYLASIAICSLLFGWLVNRLYALLGIDISDWLTPAEAAARSPLAIASAILLLALIGRSLLPARKATCNNC